MASPLRLIVLDAENLLAVVAWSAKAECATSTVPLITPSTVESTLATIAFSSSKAA